jgi:5-(carboxyamino)imidazole ribonucleotide mutase
MRANYLNHVIKSYLKEFEMTVGIIMGSKSDWPTMKLAADMLDQFGVAYETQVVSAHRTPQLLADYATSAKERGIKVIIAGAGGAAHLPGMAAAFTSVPVLGVPVQSKALKGMDSLLSIVQMPKGIAVGTLAIGEAGAANAGILAAQIIGTHNEEVMAKVEAFRSEQTETVLANPNPAED